MNIEPELCRVEDVWHISREMETNHLIAFIEERYQRFSELNEECLESRKRCD